MHRLLNIMIKRRQGLHETARMLNSDNVSLVCRLTVIYSRYMRFVTEITFFTYFVSELSDLNSMSNESPNCQLSFIEHVDSTCKYAFKRIEVTKQTDRPLLL